MEICSLVPVFTYPPLPYVYVFTISTIKKSFFGITLASDLSNFVMPADEG
jgi:hypothetical protein